MAQANTETRAEVDLTFRPVENDNPRTLTREQIQQYNRDGFIKPLPIFDDREVQVNREYVDWMMSELARYNDGRDSYAINGCHVRCAGLWDLMTDSRILDCVEDIIGPDIVAWGSHLFTKLPHDPKSVPWHQDASYWPLTPARTVTAWLALDDADMDNSAMKFLPGTHNLGHLKWKKAAGDVVLDQEVEDVERFGEPVYDTLNAGQISLHADMLAHGSDPNRSDRRRCGLTIRYCPPSVRAIQPAWAVQAILCRGEDRFGHWQNNRRPAGEDLSIPAAHVAIGGN